MKNILFVLSFWVALVAISPNMSAQPNFPEDGEVFRDDVVGRVDISINPDTLDWIYDNVNSNIMWRARFIFNNGTIHDTVEDIGFRLRGNTSRQSAKKSFKVSFNTFESGRKFYGLEKMNLNGEHNDPSVARSKISWDLCRSIEIPASRSNHVRVYINDDFYGVYINVEHVDEEFVDKRFGNQDGNLYKCLWPADLNYLGSDPELYKDGAYTLKTNTEEDDYGDIAHFIDVLNNTPIDELECELEKIFNVQDYLKIMALDVFTANWDGYIYNKNNFYLYHNTETDKFEYIPYDLDNTYGIDWFGEDWAQRNIYNWDRQSEYRPLYERLMDIQKYKDWYSWYLDQIMELRDPETYFLRLDEIRDQIYPYIQIDPYYPQDYGYSPEDFLTSYQSGTGAHVPYGLKDYISTRINSANQQIDLNNIRPVINYLAADHAGPGTAVNVSVYVFDDEEYPTVKLLYNINGGDWENVSMVNFGDHNYVEIVDIPSGETTFFYQIEASDDQGNTSLYPCEPLEINIAPGGSYSLFVNEFLASNATGITDEAGEYEDWLELYNSGDVPVWLGDKYLSDNLDNRDKWQFPDYTIQPEEFLIVWCDKDQEQGPFHTNFKISKGGEELGFFDNDASGFSTIDSIIFGEQQTDVSYGRDPDAGSSWIFYYSPTPGISNMLSASAELLPETTRLVVFPNPIAGNILQLNKVCSFEILSIRGQLVGQGIQTDQYPTGNLQAGFYLLRSLEGEVFKFIKQ